MAPASVGHSVICHAMGATEAEEFYPGSYICRIFEVKPGIIEIRPEDWLHDRFYETTRR